MTDDLEKPQNLVKVNEGGKVVVIGNRATISRFSPPTRKRDSTQMDEQGYLEPICIARPRLSSPLDNIKEYEVLQLEQELRAYKKGLKFLNKGNFGCVYEFTSNGKDYIIKTPNGDLGADEEKNKIVFKHEYEMMKELITIKNITNNKLSDHILLAFHPDSDDAKRLR